MEKIIKIGITVALMVGGFLIYQNTQNKKIVQEFGINKNDELYKYFQKNYKCDKKIIPLKAAKGDITNDGKDDLVLIFNKEGEDINNMVVLINGDKKVFTKEKRAPIDNIEIQFKDIDDKGPIETIISGSKNGNYGYAIYRLENNEMKDLFGENMKDCC